MTNSPLMSKASLSQYAFFDVDGTVVQKDSFIIFIKHCFRKSPWRFVFFLGGVPFIAFLYMLTRDRGFLKSALLWCLTVGRGKRGAVKFFKGTELQNKLQQLWFEEASLELAKLRRDNIKIVYCSASGQIWLRGLLNHCDLDSKIILGSKLGFFLGGVVIKSKNCYQEEKLRRIALALPGDFEWHSTYTDHIADIPMLLPAKNRFIISPRASHVKVFEHRLGKDGFTILPWKNILGDKI